MNCANHADASAVAYCRTCGKPLCGTCTRPVRGVIYCEECLGAKMEGVPAGTSAGASVGNPGFVSSSFSPAPFSPTASGQVPAMQPAAGSSGPNPTVAGILGAFPGVGAVYTGQYIKGLVHLAIFVLLVVGANASDDVHSEALGIICGFGIAFFIIYQIIDAVRSAKAIQMAQPAPDPFGLAATFGGGAKIETNKIPIGAIVLILLGVLFLLQTLGWGIRLDRFWPLILIFVGAWIFARNWGLAGFCCTGCQCARCRTRRLMGPAVMFTIGVLFLLQNLDVGHLHFGRTWPVILLVVGAVKLLQGSASLEGHIPPPGAGANPPGGTIPPMPGPMAPAPPVSPAQPVPPASEVNRG